MGRPLAFLLVALVLASAFVSASVAGGRATGPKWAYLIYLDADNSLDVSAGPGHVSVVGDDFAELMSVGSTADVVAYVLVDRVAGPANLFKVLKGSMVEQTTFALDGEEANMGDPATLRAFLDYVAKAEAPQHTLLVFWDHGSPEYVAYDEHDGLGGTDALTHTEVIAALGKTHVDVIANDECLVAQLEVAYEYAAHGARVDYLVAAETYTGWRGFPYDWTLGALVADPGMSAREAAVMMVEETDRLLSENPYMGEEVNDHAAIDLAQVPALASSFLDLTNLLASDMSRYASAISKARGAANYAFGANALNAVDLKTFVMRLAEVVSSKAVRDAAATVLAAFDTTVIALQATQTLDHQLYGLGLELPNHSWETPDYLWSYALMVDGFQAFLEAYWAAAGSI